MVWIYFLFVKTILQFIWGGILKANCLEFYGFHFHFTVAKNAIKQQWFQHGYCGIALGYARDHLSREAYVRCLLCRRDLKVRSRGLTSFAEHCRSERHYRLDCLLRIRRGLRLRSRTGSLLDAAEEADVREMLSGMSVPDFESCPNVTVVQVLALEESGSTIWAMLSEQSVARKKSVRMLTSVIVDAMYRDGDFESVVALWNSLVAAEPQYGNLFGMELTSNVLVVIMFSFTFYVSFE